MGKVEEVANQLTDMDWGWWPFLYLRPRPHEPMTVRRVGLMALHFGPMFGVVLGGLALLQHPALRDAAVPVLVGAALVATALFFPLYLVTFARFWNIRAARLAAQPDGLGGVMAPEPPSAAVKAFAIVMVALLVVGGMMVGFRAGLRLGAKAGRADRRQALDYEALTASGRAEGARWAPGHTQADCLEEGMRIDAPCHRIACKVENQGFMDACFTQATPTVGFCDGVRPAADDPEDMAWRERRCRVTHPEALRQCINFIPVLQGYCVMHGPARVGESEAVGAASPLLRRRGRQAVAQARERGRRGAGPAGAAGG